MGDHFSKKDYKKSIYQKSPKETIHTENHLKIIKVPHYHKILSIVVQLTIIINMAIIDEAIKGPPLGPH